MDTQVLIVGAGPVGLTLAIDLGKRGIRCTLDREERRAARLPEDGALQSADDGDFPPPRHRRDRPRRRLSAGLADGHLSAVRPDAAAAVQDGASDGGGGQGQARRHHRRLAAARALSDHLAIHARAAAEVGGGENPECRGEVRPRIRVLHRASGRRDRAGQKDQRRARSRSARSIWSAAMAARARSASSSATGWRASRTSWRCARRCSTAPSSTTRCARRAPATTIASTIIGR